MKVLGDGWAPEVHVVVQQMVQQPQLPRRGADRNRPDTRYACVRVGDALDRSMPSGSKGATDGRVKHEPRLIHEGDVSASRLRLAQDPGDLFMYPPCDLVVITIVVLVLGFLGTPIQPLFQDLVDVTGVVIYPEVPFDHLLDARARPQLIAPSVFR